MQYTKNPPQISTELLYTLNLGFDYKLAFLSSVARMTFTLREHLQQRFNFLERQPQHNVEAASTPKKRSGCGLDAKPAKQRKITGHTRMHGTTTLQHARDADHSFQIGHGD